MYIFAAGCQSDNSSHITRLSVSIGQSLARNPSIFMIKFVASLAMTQENQPNSVITSQEEARGVDDLFAIEVLLFITSCPMT